MDSGTNAKKTLLGQEVELKYGYVGIKNRSQQDIIDKISVNVALQVIIKLKLRKKEIFSKTTQYIEQWLLGILELKL
jgi:predicted membrane chloride channel (bestrophin family)